MGNAASSEAVASLQYAQYPAGIRSRTRPADATGSPKRPKVELGPSRDRTGKAAAVHRMSNAAATGGTMEAPPGSSSS